MFSVSRACDQGYNESLIHTPNQIVILYAEHGKRTRDDGGTVGPRKKQILAAKVKFDLACTPPL